MPKISQKPINLYSFSVDFGCVLNYAEKSIISHILIRIATQKYAVNRNIDD